MSKSKKQKTSQRGDIATIPREPSYSAITRWSPITPRLVTRLRYAEDVAHSGISVRDYQWRLNSLFDPNSTGGGHQPKGFDQLAALYTRYRVYRVHFRVQFTSTIAMPTICGVALTNSATSFSDIGACFESPYGQTVTVNQYQIKELRGTVSLPQLNGKTHVAYAADDTTQALVTADPSEVLNIHVVVETIDATTNLGCYSFIELVYEAEFSDPVQLAQS